jgi:hypothetical protein
MVCELACEQHCYGERPCRRLSSRRALGTAGIAAIITWVVKEVRRINDEITRIQTASVADRAQRQAMPTLRRDPRTGEWRV